ncbi:MAG: hypothetical protein BWZ10_00692 [candidate division BRC1 bacterium ADurb.BinA364]|nr:MAG: hypothetical protein BWZ10_00692 [candidate division BRC1 bacterium ADurb.BinA364]
MDVAQEEVQGGILVIVLLQLIQRALGLFVFFHAYQHTGIRHLDIAIRIVGRFERVANHIGRMFAQRHDFGAVVQRAVLGDVFFVQPVADQGLLDVGDGMAPRDAQPQIVILVVGEILVESADLLERVAPRHDGRARDNAVAHEHQTEKALAGVLHFAHWPAGALAGVVDQPRGGKGHRGFGIAAQRFDKFLVARRFGDVVGVEERHEIAAASLDAPVAGGGESLAVLAHHLDSIAESLEDFRRRIVGAVVHHDDLRGGPGLAKNALDGFGDEALVVAGGDHDAAIHRDSFACRSG